MQSADWVATYAAVVATGALFLEVRRWAESGPRIAIAVSPNMAIMSGEGAQERGLIIVTVMNRGDQPTTITGLGVNEFQSNWHALFRRPTSSFIVPRPSLSPQQIGLPALINPGQEWKGYIRTQDKDLPDFQNGIHWIAIYTSSKDRYFVKEIPMRRKPAKDEKAIE